MLSAGAQSANADKIFAGDSACAILCPMHTRSNVHNSMLIRPPGLHKTRAHHTPTSFRITRTHATVHATS